MADAGAGKLPTAVYIEFAGALGAAHGGRAAGLLEARLEAASSLPRGEATLGIGGTGVLVSFGHPTETLAYTRELMALARGAGWDLPPLRVGVHVAAMSRATAESQEATISGSSIDGAMRVASLAAPNQALATAQFQTVVVHLLKIGAGLLTPLGKRTTASGKTLEVFEVAPAPGPAEVWLPEASPSSLPPEILARIELALAGEIGPIARVLIKQAGAHLPDQERFLLHLADAVPEPERRREFLIQATKMLGS